MGLPLGSSDSGLGWEEPGAYGRDRLAIRDQRVLARRRWHGIGGVASGGTASGAQRRGHGIGPTFPRALVFYDIIQRRWPVLGAELELHPVQPMVDIGLTPAAA